MADAKKQSNDPYVTGTVKTLTFLGRLLWGITVGALKVSWDLGTQLYKGTPEAVRKVRNLAKEFRERQTVKKEAEVKAVLVRESDNAGNVYRVMMYNTQLEATRALNKDFLMNRDGDKGIPDHTLQMYELSYPEKELEEIRKETIDSDLRVFDDIDKLNDAQLLASGNLITEIFKSENDIVPFSDLNTDNLVLYDVFINEHERIKLLSEWNEKIQKENFSLEELIDCIEGRSSVSINNFAQIINNHPEQFTKFLDNEKAVVLLDAISHHPEIYKLGGMNVDKIASLNLEHIRPVNELVLCLIGKTKKNPELAQKANDALARICKEREWETKDRKIFENSYDEKVCSDIIRKYANSGCTSVLRAMMATTYMKTLDERNISQRGIFAQTVSEFDKSPVVSDALHQYELGKLMPESYTLPLYFGAVQRLVELRTELSSNESRYKNDLFTDNEKHEMLTKEIRKYTEILDNFHHSFEVQTLDVQKMKNVRIALSNGRPINVDGTIRPELSKAVSSLIGKHYNNQGVISAFEEILKGTPLVDLCNRQQDSSKFSEIKEWDKTPEELEEIKKQKEQDETANKEKNDLKEQHSDNVSLKSPLQQENNLEQSNPARYFAAAIETYGICNLLSSPEFINSFKNEFLIAYPQINCLSASDCMKAKVLWEEIPVFPEMTEDGMKDYACCLAGTSIGYYEDQNTAEELLYAAGFAKETIQCMSPEEQKNKADDIAVHWITLIEERNVNRNENEMNYLNAMDKPFPEDGLMNPQQIVNETEAIRHKM